MLRYTLFGLDTIWLDTIWRRYYFGLDTIWPDTIWLRHYLAAYRMTVVEGWFGGIKYDRVPKVAELDQAQLELIEVNAAINSQVQHPTCLCLYIKTLSPQCVVISPGNQFPFILSRVGSSLLGCIKAFLTQHGVGS